MSSDAYNTNTQQVLEQLSRSPSRRTGDTTMVTSPCAGTIARAVKIKSNSSYTVYNVITIVVGDAGTEPIEIGQQIQAVNLAESFDQQGTLAVGIYVVMFRVGVKNAFYAPA